MKPDDRENQEDARRLPNFKKIEKESSRSSRHPIDAARPAPRGSTDPPLLRIPAESESGVDLSRQKQVGKNLSAPRLARSKSRTVAEDSANTTCSVCLNIISDSAVAENCMHQFCRSCIVEWARRSNLCPVCRTSFSNIIANIRSDREFETIPVEQPSATTYNIVREVTVSRDGRNATVRTRYSLGNDVQELTEVRDLDRSREAIDPRPELNRNSLFDVFFRDVMNDQYDGGFRFPHNPTLRGPVRIPSIPGFLSIVPPSIEVRIIILNKRAMFIFSRYFTLSQPLVFPMDPRAPSTSNRPPSAQNIGPGRALSPHYSASLRRSPSIPQIPSVPYVFVSCQ